MNDNPLTVAGAATALGENIARTMFPINPFAFRLQEPSYTHIRGKRQGVNCDRVAAWNKDGQLARRNEKSRGCRLKNRPQAPSVQAIQFLCIFDKIQPLKSRFTVDVSVQQHGGIGKRAVSFPIDPAGFRRNRCKDTTIYRNLLHFSIQTQPVTFRLCDGEARREP